MTARDHLNAARLRQDPPHIIARLEQATIAEEMEIITRPPRWPWVLLLLTIAALTAAAVVPHAEPAAQLVDAGGEE